MRIGSSEAVLMTRITVSRNGKYGGSPGGISRADLYSLEASETPQLQVKL